MGRVGESLIGKKEEGSPTRKKVEQLKRKKKEGTKDAWEREGAERNPCSKKSAISMN